MPYKNENIRKEYQKEYRQRYKAGKPKSAISQYYQFYKSLLHYNKEELQVLFKKRKEQCTYAESKQEILKLRTEMTIITHVLEEIQHTL